MSQEIQPSYFANIPAPVRYSKKLKANAKLLYGEITALCSKEGYCWAKNQYFSDLYDVENRAVQRWLEQLQNEGFIYITYENEIHKSGRKIFLDFEFKKMFTRVKKDTPHVKKDIPPHVKKDTLNNTRYNNTSNSHHQETEREKENISQSKDDDDLFFDEKEKEELKTYSTEEISVTMQILKDKCQQTHNSSKVRFFLTTIRNLRKKPKNTILEPIEEIKKHFKKGELYNNAIFDYDDRAVAFTRGMKQNQVDLKYFSWDAFYKLCKEFGVNFKR